MNHSDDNTRTPRTRYHHGALRSALLEAAAKLVEEEGPTQVSLREVARRCGVSRAAPYRHFRSREALLAEVATTGFRALMEEMDRYAENLTDPVARLRAIAAAYVAFAADRPETLRLMFGPECTRVNDPELEQVANQAYTVLSATVGAALQNGSARAPQEPLVTLGVWSLVHGLARLMIDMPGEPPGFQEEDPQARSREVIDVFVDSLFGSLGSNA